MQVKILSSISESRKSSVYLADAEGIDIPVIFKTMSGDQVELFEKVRQLESEFYPHIYEVSKENGKTIVIEEFITGDTLDKYVEKNDISEGEVVALMLQVCEAVKLLHHQTPAIIHRDIKPSNIIVDEHARIKIIDLDTAREYDKEDKKDTCILGTDGYAPPEQYGYAQTDQRSDIYAIGSTLYEVLFHKRLSYRDSDKNQLPKIMFPKDKKVHHGLVEVIEKCTMFAPKSRYASIEKLEKALKHYKTKKWERIACIAGIILLFGILVTAGVYQNIMRGSKPSDKKQETTQETSKTDTTNFTSITIDTFNPINGKRENFTLFYKKNEPELSIIHIDTAAYLGRKEKPKKIRLEHTISHVMLELEPEDWEYDEATAIVTLKPSGLKTLKVKENYSLIMEFSDTVLNAEVDVIDDYSQMAKKYSSTVLIEGGYGELIREQMSEIKLCLANSFGRKITKIVDKTSKKEIDAKYYTVDEEKQILTIDKECFADVKAGEWISLMIYTESNAEIPYNEPCPLDVVVREHPYIAPELPERNFIIDRNAKKDLEIPLEWNDAKGHFQNFYTLEDSKDVIPDQYVKCKENSVQISHKFFEKKEIGEYDYVMEFGDVAFKVRFTVK